MHVKEETGYQRRLVQCSAVQKMLIGNISGLRSVTCVFVTCVTLASGRAVCG
jgi:hypothetical protein